LAVNPAEDIVNIWLQDKHGYFTRQNINVPKQLRFINGRPIHGGRGKEIDILGINNDGDRIWIEVTVSPNPYLEISTEQVVSALTKVRDKFHSEKATEVERLFCGKRYRKMFVYSPRIFSKKQDISEKEKQFIEGTQKLGVEPIRFETILEETIDTLNHYSVDPTRIYLYYAKYFLSKKSDAQQKI
jgi:hypothetical protein